MRKFSGYVRRLKEKNMMRFLDKIIQEMAKVDLRIQECQFHAGKSDLIDKIEYLDRSL